MTGRPASLRLRLLLVMIGTAIPAVVISIFLFDHVQGVAEQGPDRQKALQVAGVVARQVERGADQEELATIQSLVPNDRIVVMRGGRRVFAGPVPNGSRTPLETTVTRRFPGGEVILYDYKSPSASSDAGLALLAGIPLLLVILSAALTTGYLSRTLREPIERAIQAADRVAGGDLSARMGLERPEEFVHLSRAFDGMASRLETADQNQRQFLADLAHEIATPVNAISGFGLALADGSVRTGPERAEAAQVLAAETRRLKTLLEDLRKLTRLDLAQAVRREPVGVQALCEEVAARFTAPARAAGLAITVEAPPATIVSDRRLLEMILGNLVSNAIRYTPRGGAVRISAKEGTRDLAFSVEDSGVGIAPEQQARIFDRFYRVDEARARTTGGSGLGLSIALRAARELRGRIELESRLGAGSVFRLVLADGAERRSRAPEGSRHRGLPARGGG